MNRAEDQSSEGATGKDAQLSLAELTEAADVSVRTVRYYIAEGLLPPPVGGGPRSAYTPAHLDRLRLIGRLKAAYLPLKEIRRQLAGLDDAAVRRALGEPVAAEPGRAPQALQALADAAIPAETPPAALSEPPRILDSAADYVANLLRAQAVPGRSGAARPGPPAPHGRPGNLHQPRSPAIRATAPPSETESDAWRRIPLGEDAELLIRADAYRRKRDRVEWLVRWARKVFG